MSAPVIGDGLFDLPAGKLASVVTSLEMRQRPAVPAPEPLPGIALHRDSALDPVRYRALFRHIGEPWLWTSRLELSDAALSRIIADAAVEVWVLSHHGQDEGLLELDFRIEGECELAFFGLAQALTGRGLGRWLMGKAISQAWARRIERFWVHTCSLDHPAALPLYMRSGFVPFRRQIEVFDDPRRAGLLPATAAPNVPSLI